MKGLGSEAHLERFNWPLLGQFKNKGHIFRLPIKCINESWNFPVVWILPLDPYLQHERINRS
jgi:hypothetical protein